MPFDFHISGLRLLSRNITDLHKNIETVTDVGSAVKKNSTLTNSDQDSDDDQEQTRSWMKKVVLPTFKGTYPIGLMALIKIRIIEMRLLQVNLRFS
ncbi:hypothetical protein MtrunA17_Chr2g0330351 [Medicago truncatula]|uniref:Uncharacterized protein n=1 Tax=Medicago truncatula TaxID=3880 RepID=A0A396JG60_MEDTR|nr:hypothetical protein MtrunA17_Chr2g0330351 [Medicago truncatula]